MAVAKVHAAPTEDHVENDVVPVDTFSYRMSNGCIIVGGKPRGVLKLKLRDLLPKELLDDNEIVSIAQAFLSIRSVDGASLVMRNYNHFEAFMNRFQSDDDLNGFMEKYNELINPEMMETVRAAIDEAKTNGLKPADFEEFITKRVFELSEKQREKVRD